MRAAKRQRLLVAKANRHPVVMPPLDEVDDRVEGEWFEAKHRVCGGPGRINSYWKIFVCDACGVSPSEEAAMQRGSRD